MRYNAIGMCLRRHVHTRATCVQLVHRMLHKYTKIDDLYYNISIGSTVLAINWIGRNSNTWVIYLWNAWKFRSEKEVEKVIRFKHFNLVVEWNWSIKIVHTYIFVYWCVWQIVTCSWVSKLHELTTYLIFCTFHFLPTFRMWIYKRDE